MKMLIFYQYSHSEVEEGMENTRVGKEGWVKSSGWVGQMVWVGQ